MQDQILNCSTGTASLKVLLIDPSLFTPAYDAALSKGLLDNRVCIRWATRFPTADEQFELPAEIREPIFYKNVGRSTRTGGPLLALRKGISHVGSVARLLSFRRRFAPDIVHVQWSVLPVVDVPAIRFLRRYGPVVLTAHDLKPFNDNPTSKFQVLGWYKLWQVVDHIIVHTQGGKEFLIEAGVDSAKVTVIPHGPLRIAGAEAVEVDTATRHSEIWTIVLFGRLQHYKGIDVLIDACGRIPSAIRQTLRIVVAGEPLMDMSSTRDAILRSGLSDCIELRAERLSDVQMAELFRLADTFVFPYRNIEASGVFHMVKGLGKWIVASRLGSFVEELTSERAELVPPVDPDALARAIANSVGRIPSGSSFSNLNWSDIGRCHKNLYTRLLNAV